MLTGTFIEFGVACVFFALCLLAPAYDIDNKDKNQRLHPDRAEDDEQGLISRPPEMIRFICLVLIVIGAYTFISGLMFFEMVDTAWGWLFGDEKKYPAGGSSTTLTSVIAVWPIIAVICGGWTFLKGVLRYRKLAERGY